MWTDFFPMAEDILTIDVAMDIIEDALCMGFEFKVEDHKIYWREKVQE